ncbi:MAG: DegQ family serine endoprotease [Ferrovibrionaceae bacterium]
MELVPLKRPTRIAAGLVTGAAMLGLVFTTPFADARSTPDSFADLAAKVTPAVVNIQTEQRVSQAQPEMQLPNVPPGSPFEEFFKRFGAPQGGRPGKAEKAMALGSGFVIDPAGYVVTNNHVVGEAETITVKMSDGASYPAKLVGRDEKTDLAVLKVDAPKPLPSVPWGDSDKARVGDWVLAVGNPFGLGGSVTAGIVSARGRDIQSGPFDDFLQLDAPINRGNSGGPSFNADGQVIGINTAIYSPSGGSVGIGFAIPSNLAKPVVEQLKANGRIERGWLGVQIQPLTKELGQGVGLPDDKGALVAQVTDDSPAAKAGLKAGDVILAVGDKPVVAMKDLPKLIANEKPGQTPTLSVWRDGKAVPVAVTIGQMPGNEQVADAGPAQDNAKGQPSLGLQLAQLTPEMRQKLGVDEKVKGVVIVGVRDDSNAAEQGLRAGDVITQVGREKVTSPKQVIEKVKEARTAGQQAVMLLINRGDSSQFVSVKFGNA